MGCCWQFRSIWKRNNWTTIFHFKGDVPSFGDVLMILRPMFGGVILTLFKNIIKDKNM